MEARHWLLRWQDIGLTKEPADQELCVHIFGWTCLPSFSNHVIKRASIDVKNQFRLEAAKQWKTKNSQDRR